jgi:hypothetical protein
MAENDPNPPGVTQASPLARYSAPGSVKSILTYAPAE